MKTSIQRTTILYNQKQVSAYRLKVASTIQLSYDEAWRLVEKSRLLLFVSNGLIRFKPHQTPLPITWQVGDTVQVKMLFFGLLPIGGIHTIHFEKIDVAAGLLITKEWDHSAKIWNHIIRIQPLTAQSVYYEDEVVLYGGALTGIILLWARLFYSYRQYRWKQIARNKATLYPVLIAGSTKE